VVFEKPACDERRLNLLLVKLAFEMRMHGKDAVLRASDL